MSTQGPASLVAGVAREATISLRVNERHVLAPQGTTLRGLSRSAKPDADVVIHNGFPREDDPALCDGDEIVLIRRGERPTAQELEALLVARHGPHVHQQLKRRRVGLAGCGGLGSTVATTLCRSGVGALTLVDFDVVEPSNLNRQQYFVDQIGLSKVDALAANLDRINPYVTVDRHRLRITRERVPTLFSNCDVVAECFDSPGAKAMLTRAMRDVLPQVPLVCVSGIAGYGPASTIRSRRVLHNHFLVGDSKSAAEPGRGLLAPRVTVAAGYQANIILRLLLGAMEVDADD